MSGMNNKYRMAHFTSSMVYKLIPFGSVPMTEEELIEFKKENPKSRKRNRDGGFSAPGLTYIEEKQIEKRIGSCIDGGAHTQTLAWGNFLELVLYSVLGVQYQIASKQTLLHPKYGDFWSGSADLYTENPKTKVKESIAEIKCYQKKNFALYTDCILKKDTELMKEQFPKEYWQIVSNALINEVEIGEAITYMPYASEYEELKQMALDYQGDDQWKYRFIYELPMEDLPVIPDGGYYKNINKFAFVIPEEDKKLLTERILEAEVLLNSQ